MRTRQRLHHPRRRGAALLALSIIVTLLFLGTVVAASQVEVGIGRRSELDGLKLQERSVAASASRLAMDALWRTFSAKNPPATSGLGEFRAWLDERGIHPDADTPFDITASISDRRTGRALLDGAEIVSVAVTRHDLMEATRIVVDTVVRSSQQAGDRAVGDAMRTPTRVREVWRISGEAWKGANFALLTNNLSCAVCHMHVDSAERFYNEDPALHGTFPLVKAGALRSMRIRSGTNSTIAGKLYVGRGLAGERGGALSIDDTDLESAAFDEDGLLIQDFLGELTSTEFATAAPGDDPALANLHLEYAESAGETGDGGMPTSFPPVFPDDGGVAAGIDPVVAAAQANDHLVQREEFDGAMLGLEGVLDGGHIAVVPPGSTLPLGFAPDVTGVSGTSLGTTTIGNVVLTGTRDEPLVIDGDVGVFGDVIIQGWVQGNGSIRATGNVYIIDDVRYVDGENPATGGRTFGTAPDGTQNALGIAAGGNVLVGDFYRDHGDLAVMGTPDGPFSFLMNEVAGFNREEWLRTQPVLPFDGEPMSDPTLWTASNPFYEGAGYVPRYYSFGPDQAVPMMLGYGYLDPDTNDWVGPHRTNSWTSNDLVVADPNDPTDPWVGGATVVPMAPGGWITPDQMLGLIEDAKALREAEDRLTYEIDAALYTSNSILGIAPKSGPGTNGQTIVNGGILSADFGILSADGLYVNHDRRSTGLIKVPGGDGLVIRHEAELPPVRQ